jgi:hypothetical protein
VLRREPLTSIGGTYNAKVPVASTEWDGPQQRMVTSDLHSIGFAQHRIKYWLFRQLRLEGAHPRLPTPSRHAGMTPFTQG